jgi:serine phosphatase RsbU (regulator of sigma subunit)
MVVRADGRVEELGLPGTLLGPFAREAVFENVSTELHEHDALVLYTDGVTEARAPDGSFFGEQRLADLIIRHLAAGLPAPETMRRVVRALLEHQNGRLTDDASLALLQWQTDVQAITP